MDTDCRHCPHCGGCFATYREYIGHFRTGGLLVFGTCAKAGR